MKNNTDLLAEIDRKSHALLENKENLYFCFVVLIKTTN